MNRPKNCHSPYKEFDCILDIDCTYCLYWQDKLTSLETSLYYIDCLSLEMPHDNPELKYIKEFIVKQNDQLKTAYEQVVDLFYEEMCPTDKRSFMSEAESWLEENK